MTATIGLTLTKTLEFEESPDLVWDLLADVPVTVSCIPGAELLETVSDSAWKARIGVDLGLTQVTFVTDVLRPEFDREAGRAVLTITGEALNGRGEAAVTIVSTVSTISAGTQAQIVTEMQMSGHVARLGPGIIEDVSDEMTEQFSACLRHRLKAQEDRSRQLQDGNPNQSVLRTRAILRTVLLGRLRHLASKLRLIKR